jgi:hypothetical protein
MVKLDMTLEMKFAEHFAIESVERTAGPMGIAWGWGLGRRTIASSGVALKRW